MKFYRVTDNHLVTESGLNAKRIDYKGHGRPRRSDYMESDITPKQRARINKMIRANKSKARVAKRVARVVTKKTLSITDVVLISIFAVTVVAYLFHINYTSYEVPDAVLSPFVVMGPKWEVNLVDTTPEYCKGEINSLFCNPDYKWDAKKMIAICMSENWYDKWDEKGWKPYLTNNNTNGTEDVGICMINSIHGEDRNEMFIPSKNVAKAYDLFLSAQRRGGTGYEPWVAHNNGNYLGYIGRL